MFFNLGSCKSICALQASQVESAGSTSRIICGISVFIQHLQKCICRCLSLYEFNAICLVNSAKIYRCCIYYHRDRSNHFSIIRHQCLYSVFDKLRISFVIPCHNRNDMTTDVLIIGTLKPQCIFVSRTSCRIRDRLPIHGHADMIGADHFSLPGSRFYQEGKILLLNVAFPVIQVCLYGWRVFSDFRCTLIRLIRLIGYNITLCFLFSFGILIGNRNLIFPGFQFGTVIMSVRSQPGSIPRITLSSVFYSQICIHTLRCVIGVE